MTYAVILITIVLHSMLINWQSEQEQVSSFPSSDGKLGNSNVNHFLILDEDKDSVLVGGRNRVYNLSIYDLKERKEYGILWHSSEAHRQLCILKGKSDDDCQNYIRVAYKTVRKFFVCGTNSYKPYCRTYLVHSNGKYDLKREVKGTRFCPPDPEINSTTVFSNRHVFAATVADFSGDNPLIYRQPQTTEPSELIQLNGPNFVGSVAYGDYVFFFFTEIALEHMNSGKPIYSRVGRVCKNDKGGPNQSRRHWTSFLKTRLNCSVPGEYPFYFDEIQSTSKIIEGSYQNKSHEVIYGILTTPINAIGGSAVCMYSMKDILWAFEGSFKSQENIDANWLPVPASKVPEPRPGRCVPNSRLLPEKTINFIQTHSLMDDAVAAMFGKPLLIKVSQKYRFTTVLVDSQVLAADNNTYDVLYLGTDNGQIFKAVNIPSENSMKAIVISENSVFQEGASIKQIKLGSGYGKVIAVSKNELKLVNLNHCHKIQFCRDCVKLQDPYCAWDPKQTSCVSLDVATDDHYLIQDVVTGDENKCWQINDEVPSEKNSMEPLENSTKEYSNETIKRMVIGFTLLGFLIGFVSGFVSSKCIHHHLHAPIINEHVGGDEYNNVPFIGGQQNHRERIERRAG